MSVSAVLSRDGEEIHIRVSERLDYRAHAAFRSAYECAGRPFRRYVVDLGETAYIDSAGLAMLLQLRSHAGGTRQSVAVVNARPPVRALLETARLDRLLSVA